MKVDNNERLCVITGASGGIGLACAKKLAQQGMSLLLVARRESRLAEIAEMIGKEFGVECSYIACDITKDDSIDKIALFVSHSQHTLYALVNNAGGSSVNLPITEISPYEWMKAFQLNLFSAVNLCLALIPKLVENKGGRIINISSINAKTPGYMNPHYSSAKAALNNFTKYLSNFYAEEGVTVNSVSPGIIDTEGLRWHLENAEQSSTRASVDSYIKKVAMNIPLRRVGQASEVAGIVSFLCTTDAAYITGSDFVVDGGKRKEI